MPTISAHVSDEVAEVVIKAAACSSEKKPGPWIAEAVRQRLERDGMLPGDPQAEVLASAAVVGFDAANSILVSAGRVGVPKALAALQRETKRGRKGTPAKAA